MVTGSYICRQTRNIFRRTQLDHQLNISDKFKKKSGLWSQRRCNNEIVNMLSKGQFTILKMVAIWPHLMTNQNNFQVNTSRLWKEFICKVSTKFLQCFQRRCDNVENQKWLPVAIFVDRLEPFLDGHNYTTRKRDDGMSSPIPLLANLFRVVHEVKDQMTKF